MSGRPVSLRIPEEVRAVIEDADWLSEQQLRTALAYASAYPEEIERKLDDDDRWTPEAVWSRYPFTKPRDRQCVSTWTRISQTATRSLPVSLAAMRSALTSAATMGCRMKSSYDSPLRRADAW